MGWVLMGASTGLPVLAMAALFGVGLWRRRRPAGPLSMATRSPGTARRAERESAQVAQLGAAYARQVKEREAACRE
jgi:MYXO-CTERM domain-containing protein